MKFKKMDQTYVVRMEVGDDIVQEIKQLAKQEQIQLATVQGIGACDLVELGLYKVPDKEYKTKTMHGEMELTSLLGNISEMNGQTYVHLHANLADEDMHAFGGHLDKAIVSGTGEIFIQLLKGQMDRKVCEKTGINVFDI